MLRLRHPAPVTKLQALRGARLEEVGHRGKVLTRVHDFASERRVRFTMKALRELATLGLGLDSTDACDVLVNLTAEDSAGRMSSEMTGEWMYAFKPRVGGALVYVKLILRNECVVVSFHEEEGGRDEEET